MTNEIRVAPDALKTYLHALFAAVGMSEANAAICASFLRDSNLWGIDSHGILRVPIYIERLAKGVIKANPQTYLSGGRAFELMHGDNGMGFIVAHAAMERAIALAGEHRIGAVGVTASNHFGAAALYAKMAVDNGMIGIVMTNVTPNLIFPGGSKAITGNNPIAIGAPTDEPFPFLLDMSTSAVAGGKLLLAAEKKEKIPLDWATDREGRFTDDPTTGFAGFLLPLGGHKGFGLSLAVDLLCGVVTGGAFQFALKSMYKDADRPSETGHMMIVIDPTIAMSIEDYRRRMKDFYATIKSSPMWQPDKEMFLPGEIEYRTRQQREKSGIPIPIDLANDLKRLGETYQLTERLSPL